MSTGELTTYTELAELLQLPAVHGSDLLVILAAELFLKTLTPWRPR